MSHKLFIAPIGVFLVALSFALHAQVPEYIPSDGLVAWYPLDADAEDYVGTNDGQIIGCTNGTNRFGSNNSAIQFDGPNDRISLGTFFNGQQMASVSYSLWFRSDGSSTTQYISGKEGFWKTIYIRLLPSGAIRFGGTSQGVYFGLSSAEDSFQLDTWHHLVVTFESSTIKLYLDGSIIASGPSTASLLQYQFHAAGNSTATNYLGAIQPATGITGFFLGTLDDFGLWDRALTPDEVNEIYTASAPTPYCADEAACNYNEEAGCIFPEPGYNCEGSCLNDADQDDVCDEFEVFGCDDPLACNFDELVTEATASCDYSCCPGPGCCSPGMTWDFDLEVCVANETCIGDLNGDTQVGASDLMLMLSIFGLPCEAP